MSLPQGGELQIHLEYFERLGNVILRSVIMAALWIKVSNLNSSPRVFED